MKRNILMIIATALIIFGMWMYSPQAVNNHPINVLTVNAETKNIYDYINAGGKIKEGNKRNIYIDNIATITKVYVEVGDVVDENTILAEITPVSVAESDFSDYVPDISEIESIFREYGVDVDLKDNFNDSFVHSAQIESVVSPIRGTVTAVNIKEGDTVTAVNRLMSVSDFSDLYIEAMIPEEYSSQVAEGKSAEISAEAFGDISFNGKIKKVYPTAKYIPSLTGEGKTYIEALISIDKPTELLRPGLSVNTKIAANVISDALTLPYECIMQDENNNEYVYCVENGIVRRHNIEIGYTLEDSVEIKKGIGPEDKIIISPPEEIMENTHVKESG